MARVFLSGGFGTIGRWVLRELLQRGHEVTVFELPSARHRGAARRLSHARLHVRWGDLRDRAAVAAAVAEAERPDVIVHMAFILTPATERDPEGSHAVNVGGTRNLIDACRALARRPRFLFCSSVEVFGKNRHLEGPRRIGDPVHPTSVYTTQKIECERLVRESGLDAAILRFAAVIDISLASSHELMFEFPVDVRFEVLHPGDAAVAVAGAVEVEAVWGRGALLLIGGGPSCRTTYGDFLARILTTLGVGRLPDEAFTLDDYPSDWLDTEESERLLGYQRHSLEDILHQIEALLGWRKALVPLARPFVRRSMLSRSRYYREHAAR